MRFRDDAFLGIVGDRGPSSSSPRIVSAFVMMYCGVA